MILRREITTKPSPNGPVQLGEIIRGEAKTYKAPQPTQIASAKHLLALIFRCSVEDTLRPSKHKGGHHYYCRQCSTRQNLGLPLHCQPPFSQQLFWDYFLEYPLKPSKIQSQPPAFKQQFDILLHTSSSLSMIQKRHWELRQQCNPSISHCSASTKLCLPLKQSPIGPNSQRSSEVPAACTAQRSLALMLQC